MTTYELKYNIGIEDYVAFYESYQQNSAFIQKSIRNQRFLILGFFFVAGVIFAILGAQGREASLSNLLTTIIICTLCTAPGLLIFALLPRTSKKSSRSVMEKVYLEGKNQKLLGPQKLVLETDAITVRNDYFESRYSWVLIERMVSTADHIFLFIGSITAIVIPKLSVTDGDWKEVEKIIKEKMKTIEE